MRILHLLSQLQPTGAEAYACLLAKKQMQSDHTVFMASDNYHFPTDATKFQIALGKRSILRRLTNVWKIRGLIKENQIEILHAHSRAASWVGNIASKLTGIPLISTIHGRQHIHASSTRTNPYGQHIIAVCKNLETHLKDELNIHSTPISVLPNLFEETEVHATTPKEATLLSTQYQWIGIFGRSSGPKGVKISQWIMSLRPFIEGHPKIAFVHAGGPLSQLSPEAREEWKKISQEFPGRLESLGFTPLLSVIQKKCKAQIASGRIAIEGLMRGVLTLASGEGAFEEVITPQNLQPALASNFGDIDARFLPIQNVNPDALHRLVEMIPSLLGVESVNTRKKLSEECMEFFNADRVEKKIDEIYRAVFSKKSIGLSSNFE